MQGQQWGVHVLEGAWAWLLAAIYIAATVISGHPPFISIANVSCAYVVVMLLTQDRICYGTSSHRPSLPPSRASPNAPQCPSETPRVY